MRRRSVLRSYYISVCVQNTEEYQEKLWIFYRRTRLVFKPCTSRIRITYELPLSQPVSGFTFSHLPAILL
jgi:hypothetical protein